MKLNYVSDAFDGLLGSAGSTWKCLNVRAVRITEEMGPLVPSADEMHSISGKEETERAEDANSTRQETGRKREEGEG